MSINAVLSAPVLTQMGVAYTQTSGPASLAWLMIAVPGVVSGLLLVLGRRSDRWGHWLAVGASWFSFVVGLAIFVQLLALPAGSRRLDQQLFTWIPAGSFQVNVGLLVDPLSVTFVLLVTLVGSLIHTYAVGYMADDPDRRRFFAYFNFFIASMLILVLADGYAVLFVGWEGVGLASYLLIGFWNQVPENATAAKKAFVMNRVGDVGLLLAMGAMVASFGSVTFTDVNAGIGTVGSATATVIGLFLLLAACGKSAQFPLQAWLMDAMAGPTPVSALIHAATMVTAGVYLIVRSGAVYVAAPIASTAVAIVGAITLLLGAIIGCAKDDFKRVLAASTMSQIGYMMLGAGLGPVGWAFAIFHLFTHGFFKGLLFLGAGSVMHSMNGQVNMRRFGALRTVMRTTWLTFAAGWLAILGIPPFSGFFSKDRLIEVAFAANTFGDVRAPWAGWVYGLVALVGAGITAFYMSRLFFMTFHGRARWTTQAEGDPVHPHESGPIMTVPMIVLSVGAVVLGALLIGNWFPNWLTPALGATPTAEPALPTPAIQVLALVLVLLGAWFAWVRFGRAPVPIAVPQANAFIHAARNDLYQDAVNETAFMAPSVGLVRGVTAADRGVVDGAVEGVGKLAVGTGRVAVATQSGFVRGYASYIMGGVVVALAIVLGFRI